MADQYPTFIRKRGVLAVIGAPNFNSSAAWGDNFLRDAVREFNILTQRYRLGFRLETPADSLWHLLFPQVIVQAHDGSGTYVDAKGEFQTISFDKDPNLYTGHTVKVNGGGNPLDPGYFRQQSWIFMPRDPMVDGVKIGRGVRMTVLLHEFIHAAGLESADSNHGNGKKLPPAPRDVYTSAGYFSHSSSDPEGERDFVSLGDTRSPLANGEFEMSGLTVRALLQNWKV